MMKKLIGILLGFALFTFLGNAQILRNSHTMGANESFYTYTCTSADVVSGRWVVNGLSHDSLAYDILVNKSGPVNVNCRVEVTSRGGTTDTYEYTLLGKIFANDTYAAIATATGKYAAFTVTDTTRFGAAYARPDKFYRYFRMRIIDDNSCAATDSLVLSKIIFKVYER
jgi:hypothetical protein